ncbi:YncE family protein [Corynebacterium sp. S7]
MKNLRTIALISTLALGLTACSQNAATESGQAMGDAKPQASPQDAQPVGDVHQFDPIIDMDQTGDVLGVRTASALTVGTIDEITAGSANEIQLDDTCTDVSANDGKFVISCGTTVRVFDSATDSESSITTEKPVQSSTIVRSGEIIAASGEENKAYVYRDGTRVDDFMVQDPTDEIIAVQHDDGQPDSVVRINRLNTTIQDLDWENGRAGGTLRVGIGVGQAVPGNDGLVIVSDALAPQLAIYTTGEVIRLQQTAPVPEGPWGVAWDNNRHLAWIASTSTNTASGYDISNGVPLQKATVNTVPDALDMAVLADGTLVFASASGAGIQVVPPTSVSEEGK